jgi:hypothetical protein
VLASAQSGTLPGLRRTGVTVNPACDELPHFLGHSRQRKPSTLRDYASILDNHVRPPFGETMVEDVTYDDVVAWASSLAARTISCSPTGRSLRSSSCSMG